MRVAELWRYPVKALRGEALERADLDGDGVRGDRLLRVDDEDGKTITARTARSLLGLHASVGEDGEPLINRAPWREPASLYAARAAPGAQFARTDEGSASPNSSEPNVGGTARAGRPGSGASEAFRQSRSPARR